MTQEEKKLIEWACPCNIFLQRTTENEAKLNRLITSNESLVHHYQPESKYVSMQ